MNGGSDVIIGGGVESITMTTRNHDPHPRLLEKEPGVYMVMGDTAEVVAKRYKIGRQSQDESRSSASSAPPAPSAKDFSRTRSLPCA